MDVRGGAGDLVQVHSGQRHISRSSSDRRAAQGVEVQLAVRVSPQRRDDGVLTHTSDALEGGTQALVPRRVNEDDGSRLGGGLGRRDALQGLLAPSVASPSGWNAPDHGPEDTQDNGPRGHVPGPPVRRDAAVGSRLLCRLGVIVPLGAVRRARNGRILPRAARQSEGRQHAYGDPGRSSLEQHAHVMKPVVAVGEDRQHGPSQEDPHPLGRLVAVRR